MIRTRLVRLGLSSVLAAGLVFGGAEGVRAQLIPDPPGQPAIPDLPTQGFSFSHEGEHSFDLPDIDTLPPPQSDGQGAGTEVGNPFVEGVGQGSGGATIGPGHVGIHGQGCAVVSPVQIESTDNCAPPGDGESEGDAIPASLLI